MCAKFFMDVTAHTLTISKAFEINAAIVGSEEQSLMSKYIKAFGDMLIIEYYEPRKASKGLSFAQMENYIKHTRDAAAMLERFATIKKLSQSQKNPYKYVKDWFLFVYPNYSEQPEFDEDGFVIAKAAAENHTQTDGESAQTTPSSQAEEPTSNTGNSRLSEGEEAAAQTGAAA